VPYAGKRVKLFKRRISFENEEALSSDVEEEGEDFSADELDKKKVGVKIKLV
jgi:hypothetical protein